MMNAAGTMALDAADSGAGTVATGGLMNPDVMVAGASTSVDEEQMGGTAQARPRPPLIAVMTRPVAVRALTFYRTR